MDWRRLELWITLAKRLLPAGSPAQRVAAAVAEYLSELGSIGSGGLIVIILILVGGTVTMALLTKGVDLFREMTGRNDQLRTEGAEKKETEIRDRLRELGVDLDELLHSGKNGAGEAKSGDGDEEPGAGSTDDP